MTFPDRQSYDDLVWEKNESKWDEMELLFRLRKNHRIAGSIIEKSLAKSGSLHRGLIGGSYNILYRMSFDDGSQDVLLRIPCLGIAQFPTEKLLSEVATMRLVARNTSVLVPPIHYFGESEENPAGLGPFMIIGYLDHKWSLSGWLASTDKADEWDPDTLDPAISDSELKDLYIQLAGCLRDLSKLEFPRIGALMPKGDWQSTTCDVAGRPLPVNITNLRQLANVPPSVLPPEGKTYPTADDWYVAMADMHMAQLVFQRNDLVQSLDDGRNKYVARVLFRRLAKEGKLSTFGFSNDTWSAQALSVEAQSEKQAIARAPDNKGPFRLWCDDLRAGNILLSNDLQVTGIIDWEFSYAAPAQFALDPPWWLMLAEPEKWPGGLEEWAAKYERCLAIWIESMRTVEQKAAAEEIIEAVNNIDFGCAASNDNIPSNTRPVESLSEQHRQSWDQGRFWLNYAARKSWVFDAIYWKYLDERFFGISDELPSGHEDSLWERRADLLTEEERQAMETLVAIKMEEAEARTILDWDAEEAKRHLSSFLI